MTTLALSMPSPASPKRSYDAAGLGHDFLPDPASAQPYISQPFQSLNTSGQEITQRDLIPSVETNNPIGASITPSSAPSSTAEKPAKRVKLSSEEKEAKRIEKEVKDRLRAEEKAKREEEKVKRDAEKAIKDEERRKAKEAKDEQARLKEEEKQKKEEERMKKARVCFFSFIGDEFRTDNVTSVTITTQCFLPAADKPDRQSGGIPDKISNETLRI